MANSIGVGGIPGFLSIQAQHMTMFAISMVVAIAVPFILTIVFAKTRMNKFSFKK
jgi:trehalose PTS system EIIBC or EIIBCA component